MVALFPCFLGSTQKGYLFCKISLIPLHASAVTHSPGATRGGLQIPAAGVLVALLGDTAERGAEGMLRSAINLCSPSPGGGIKPIPPSSLLGLLTEHQTALESIILV